MILAKHQAIDGCERRLLCREMLESAQMRRTPVGALAKHEAATGEELQNVVPRLEDLPLKRLATPHDVADALLRLARNAHRREFAGAVEAPLPQRPMKNVTSAARF